MRILTFIFEVDGIEVKERFLGDMNAVQALNAGEAKARERSVEGRLWKLKKVQVE